MQSSHGSGPRILRCPNCGAPIDAPPFAQSARCTYCHQTVVLADPKAQRPLPSAAPHAPASYAPHAPASYAPAPYLPTPATASSGVGRVVVVVALFVVAALAASLIALRPQTAPPVIAAPAPPARAAQAAARPPEPTTVAKPAPKYPLASLLRVNATTVDVDGAQAHMLALFPTITPERRSDVLSFKVPLNDPWFKEAELNWANEKAGLLKSMALRPAGEGWFKNQKEVADCLAKSLGQPREQEIDHLSHETSYLFAAHWPKASVDVYASYLWLSFENSKGIGTLTFANVVKTLDDCTPHAR